ncbi:MAG: hypothetical protein HN353_08035 [Bdellovibrionales bacterium]|jgi:hypothetical protein|nr:hypothetical protein [Bdellovibrionales bacterium]MBT3525869.1 hypothetical protein [Bdellovibrionales bacterium]MBT7668395.1 hypothetical protein [Bdellovibrionales bacterium]MBT7766605.1 hypothetical protein [Bdellovibrionales bacterium]
MSKSIKVAGLSLTGSRKDNFYLSLLEYYEDSNRFFLSSLLQVGNQSGDDAIPNWISTYMLTDLIVDFPLSKPPCEVCQLTCPGLSTCPDPKVQDVRERIELLLKDDNTLSSRYPKQYERERNQHDEVNYSRDICEKEPYQHLLSRSFKRRLRKGFLPYWNRSIDLWVWMHYFDQLLSLFNISYDSFGSTSLMLLSRFAYLKRHFNTPVNFHESRRQIILIELLKERIIHKRDILNLNDLDLGPIARREIIQNIEQGLSLFIYDHDMEILVEKQRAFDSFLLSLAGKSLCLGHLRTIPPWADPAESRLVVPTFQKVSDKSI